MRALTWRNGVVESTDEIDAIVVDGATTLAAWGDPERVIFYRSAIKPVQATVVQELGADLAPEHLALAVASHSGYPIQLATVEAILEGAGLDHTALRTTPAWPIEQAARDRLIRAGYRHPKSLFHNCSGKHASFLRACVAQGWPTETYLDPDHPLQKAVGDRVTEMSGIEGRPAGVDGCGAPAFRGSLRGLAGVFSQVASASEFRPVAAALSRFPSLVSGPGRPDGILGRWWVAPLKVGAQGILGAGRHGIGLAVKSRSGSAQIATMGMIRAMQTLGMLSTAAVDALTDVARPPVLGGGRIQGRIQIESGPPQ